MVAGGMLTRSGFYGQLHPHPFLGLHLASFAFAFGDVVVSFDVVLISVVVFGVGFVVTVGVVVDFVCNVVIDEFPLSSSAISNRTIGLLVTTIAIIRISDNIVKKYQNFILFLSWYVCNI